MVCAFVFHPCFVHCVVKMLLSEDEVKIKSQLWFAENGEFLKERECKLVLNCQK